MRLKLNLKEFKRSALDIWIIFIKGKTFHGRGGGNMNSNLNHSQRVFIAIIVSIELSQILAFLLFLPSNY